jgi:hypothetical protein
MAFRFFGLTLLADARQSPGHDKLIALCTDDAKESRASGLLVEAVQKLELPPPSRVYAPSLSHHTAPHSTHDRPSIRYDIAERPLESYMSELARSLVARGQDKPLAGLPELATQHEVSANAPSYLESFSPTLSP